MQQGNRGTLWLAPALFPVPEGMNADAHGLSELGLGEPNETSQRCYVLAGLEVSQHEALPDACGNGPGKMLLG